jgi:type I restriction enzyme S subunit
MKAMIPSAQLRSPFLAYWLLSKEQHILTTCVKKGATVQSIAMENLRSQELPLPPLPEQDRIVEILDLADALRQQRRQADALSQRILPALFQEMFGNPQVETIKSGERLGDYITESNYGLSAKANEDDTGIPMLRMNNVTYEGHLNLESLKYLNPNTPNLARSMLRKGDLLFNRTNSRELVGKTALWGPDISAVAASYLIIFRVDESKLLPEFVWAYMNMPFFKELLLNTARKAIGMANINSKEIAAFPIWKPPLDRQSHFKDAIARLEQSRKEQTTSAATLETLFQTLLHRAFDGSLTAKWREGQAKELLQEMERKVRQRS